MQYVTFMTKSVAAGGTPGNLGLKQVGGNNFCRESMAIFAQQLLMLFTQCDRDFQDRGEISN
jgi:hypothetical protein